jgi:hypothetical protein
MKYWADMAFPQKDAVRKRGFCVVVTDTLDAVLVAVWLLTNMGFYYPSGRLFSLTSSI